MRLSTSLTVWLVALSAVVLSAQGWRQLVEEREHLYAAASRETTLVATAISNAVENALRDGQEADIGSLLERLELEDPAFDVFVLRGDANLVVSSWGSTKNLSRARRVAVDATPNTDLRIVRLLDGDIAAVAPLRAGNVHQGQIVILRPSKTLREDLQEERWAIFASIGSLVVLLSTVIGVVVNLRVQRPISRMIRVVRRIAGGDLSIRLRRQGSDELAELAREFDAMLDALESARSQLSREAAAREKLEAEMLRANRLAIVGELAATFAHEIGSPLQVLGGRAEDIALRRDVPEQVGRSARIIVQQVDRVHHIVERFLDVARRKAPLLDTVILAQVIGEVVELLGSQARRCGVELEALVPDELSLVADAAQVQQVLLNLLQNAFRASPRGATVRIVAAPSSFSRSADGPRQPSMAISVEDEGTGLGEGEAARVFVPFFTAWKDSPTHGVGTGLGLTVVRTIVTDHGGIVLAESSPSGRGTRFTAHFPTAVETNVAGGACG